MKSAVFRAACALLFALSVHAGPEPIVKERAKGIRDQNNARQQASKPSQPLPAAPPSTAAIKPAPIKPTPTARLKSDLLSWSSEPTISAESKKTFASDLLTAARGRRRPSSATVERFADSLGAAAGGRTIGASELSRLVQNLNLAVNSAGLSPERADEVAAQVQADLELTGATQTAAAAAAKDLKVIMDELSL